MKIVDRQTFLAMPANTLFSKYSPIVFDELLIKGDTVNERDFYVQRITDSVACEDTGQFYDILESARENGTSFQMDFDIEGRDAMFDADQLFVVWEPVDVSALIERLKQLV